MSVLLKLLRFVVPDGVLREMRRPPSAAEIGAAIARIDVTRDGDTATLPPGAYESIPSAEARIGMLRGVASDATRVVVFVSVVPELGRAGRIAVDAPRRLLRFVVPNGVRLRFGARVPEPGDRFEEDRFRHVFFDEEPLIVEAAAAGLALASRKGSRFEFEHAEPWHEAPASFASELLRAARIARASETRRTRSSPERAIAEARALGASADTRGPTGRARLRRAVGWIDGAFPSGPNCYRRTLMEIALDAGAARETVVFGLDVGTTGHAALKDREDRTFDVAFEIPPR